MRRKIITFALLLISALATSAQTDGNKSSAEKIVFEGELRYHSEENYNKFIIDNTFGMSYNGVRNTRYIIKGDKVLYIDECTHVYTLIDGNTVTLYSDLINKGISFEQYNGYAKAMLNIFSKEGKSYMGHKMQPTLYRFENEGTTTLMERTADYHKGRIEDATASTDFDIYAFSSFVMPKAYTALFLRGIEIDGIIGKTVWKQTNMIGDVMKDVSDKTKRKIYKKMSKIAGTKVTPSYDLNSYCMSKLTDIKERVVDDSEFSIPSNIKIYTASESNLRESASSITRLTDFYKENHAYLLNHNMYPTQVNREVVFSIDEEWDF